MPIFLSYILTTYNKLPYLQQTLPPLLKSLEADEELIITDGGSSDGTPDFVRGLIPKQNNITFISEKDRGEAHGFNKGMLLAKGEYLKIITDDDIYNYPEIKKVKTYLKNRPDCDVVMTNVYETTQSHFPEHWLLTNEEIKFRDYLSKGIAFDFIGISLFMRRSSLPLLGLFNTSVKCVDAEYTVRFAKLKARVLFYTGATAFRIENSDSTYHKLSGDFIYEERQRINYFWNDQFFSAENKVSSLIKKAIRKVLKSNPAARKSDEAHKTHSLDELYSACFNLLVKHDNSKAEFLANY
jgi:glycosyltransferase involved in cell wall biosynthesis